MKCCQAITFSEKYVKFLDFYENFCLYFIKCIQKLLQLLELTVKKSTMYRSNIYIRGGKMCYIVEGHNITVPQKSGGAREALFTNFQKKSGSPGPPGPPRFCHLCFSIQKFLIDIKEKILNLFLIENLSYNLFLSCKLFLGTQNITNCKFWTKIMK